VDFFHELNALYDHLSNVCTHETCDVMSAGPKYEYFWMNGDTKKRMKVSAPDYVLLLMTWIQGMLDDDSIFPYYGDSTYPESFQTTAKQIFKRLFRVYAHIYYSHFHKIISLGEEAHLNTSFMRFYHLITELSLVDKKELGPLQELINHLTKEDENKKLCTSLWDTSCSHPWASKSRFPFCCSAVYNTIKPYI